MNQAKPKKAQGPIRWGAVLPFTIITLLTIIYMHFFFDGHLRRGLQWGLTKALGVQVDVHRLETSFLRAHISIGGIEITNAEKPTHNSVSIGEIRFGMLWDALLRVKFVINEAVVEQIEFAKPRATPGWVAPPEPPKPVSNEPSALEKEANKLKDQALDKVETQYNENMIGDLAAVLGGGQADVQMDKLQGSLESKKMAQTLESEIKNKQEAWNQRLKSLPQGAEFQALGERLKNVKTSGFKTPQELEQSLRELDTVFKEADAKIKTIQGASNDLNADLKKIDSDVKALEAQIKLDVKKLETHFRIPQLDAKALTMGLLKKYVDPYMNKFQTYRALAEKYVPPNIMKKGSKEPDPAIQPRPRAKGVSYEFGHPNSYPMFWIKRTAVSSQAGMSPYSGNIKGEILDISTNQVLTGKPTIANIEGDFPAAEINGFSSKLSIDNRREDSLIELAVGIQSYGVTGRPLVESADVGIGFKKAAGSLTVKSSLKALREFSMRLDNNFQNVEYDITAKNEMVGDTLKKIFAGIPVVTIDATFSGRLPQINTSINSNLGDELRKGLEREVNAKIAEARAKIEKYVQDEIGKNKAQIDAEVAKLKNGVEKEMKKIQDQADSQKKQAEAKTDQAKKDAENSAKKALEKDAGKAVEDLKKKLGW